VTAPSAYASPRRATPPAAPAPPPNTGGVDLHAHTTASDGDLSPTGLIEVAARARLEAVAVTDHDTVAGIPEAIEAGARLGVTVVPGIEISCDVPRGTCHVLGYYVDAYSPFLAEPLLFLRKRRLERAAGILDRLSNLGMSVSIPARSADSSVGRPHIAKALLDAGHVGSTQEAFERFLAEGRPAFIAGPRLLPHEAFEMILRAGGVPVLAHPHTFDNEAMIRVYAKQGLCGIEGRYAGYNATVVARWVRLAKELNLVVTSGSDFHGSVRPDRPLGMVRSPLELLDELQRKRRS
jgi:predicted metal-dependent phosphoesterase TrpH